MEKIDIELFRANAQIEPQYRNPALNLVELAEKINEVIEHINR